MSWLPTLDKILLVVVVLGLLAVVFEIIYSVLRDFGGVE